MQNTEVDDQCKSSWRKDWNPKGGGKEDLKEGVSWLGSSQTYIRGEKILQPGSACEHKHRARKQHCRVPGLDVVQCGWAEIVRGGAEAHGTRLKTWPYDRGEAGNMALGLVDISPKENGATESFQEGE